MSKILYTVDNLVQEVRSQVDEANEDSVDTQLDILPALNRGNEYAFDTYARLYPEPILQSLPLTLVGDVADYAIPDGLFEDRVLAIEIMIPSSGRATYREVQQIAYSDVNLYESSSKTNVPYYYCIIGRTIHFTPCPTGTYSARLWCLKQVEKLVLPQGRITISNPTSNYVVVDSAGASLTTEVDQLGSYVNIINGQTGEIRGTVQIQSILDNRITFRTSPLRTTVLNRTVSPGLSTITFELDDYLCGIDGTCVPYFGTPTTNFLIQFASESITRKLGGDAATEEKALEKFEQQVERTWVRRQTTMRVKKRSQNWGVPVRRWEWE